METRDFPLRVKALEDSGAFIGLAASYGNTDLAGDVIEPGAFRQAIIQQPAKGYPLLWSHKQDEPIGTGRVEDSREGLIVHGQLLMDDPAAARAYSHLKAGTVRGLSIGFTLPRGDGKVAYGDDGVRILKEIRLHEVSIVAVPANPKAEVLTVKSMADVKRLVLGTLGNTEPSEDLLCDLRELNRELKSYLGAHDPTQSDAETLSALKAFAAELKRYAA